VAANNSLSNRDKIEIMRFIVKPVALLLSLLISLFCFCDAKQFGINNAGPSIRPYTKKDKEFSVYSLFQKQGNTKISSSSSLKEKEQLYEAYNQLHTLAQDFHKPFDAPAVIVVGHQTSGKSALIEALMGFQFNQVCITFLFVNFLFNFVVLRVFEINLSRSCRWAEGQKQGGQLHSACNTTPAVPRPCVS
jgi:hypothetical protein